MSCNCEEIYNCCDCGGNGCECAYCWSCNACEDCLSDSLVMHCANCYEWTETEYSGLQHGLPVRDDDGQLVKMPDGKYLLKSIELYTCKKCGSTYGKEIE